MTNIRDHVSKLIAYHHWATDKALDALADVTPAELDRQWGGSFGTGRTLLNHVFGVERLWCDRWNGIVPKGIPSFPATYGGRDYRDAWNAIKPDQKHYIDALTPERIAGDITYVNIKGETWTYPLLHILTHVVNHGTYHRGQIAQLLRDLGRTAPGTDFLLFGDVGKKH